MLVIQRILIPRYEPDLRRDWADHDLNCDRRPMSASVVAPHGLEPTDRIVSPIVLGSRYVWHAADDLLRFYTPDGRGRSSMARIALGIRARQHLLGRKADGCGTGKKCLWAG